MFDVITIGTATRDVFLTSHLFRVLKDPTHLKKLGFKTGEAECFALGSKIEVNKPVLAVGGGAANAAVTFARQGLKTAALARVGDDELGDSVEKLFKEERVSSMVVRSKKDGTAYSTLLLTPSGERTVLVYRGASEGLDKKEVSFNKLKTKWAYIVPGKIDLSLMMLIIDKIKKNGGMVAMNPSKHYLGLGVGKLKPLFRKIDVVILNREEASYLSGEDYKSTRKIFKYFDEMIDGIAIMTDGPKGAYASDGKYLYKSGIFKEKKLIDRTGAGDAFGSGFIAGLIKSNDINYALRLASANSTSVVEEIGAQEGVLREKDFKNKRWQYLDLDIEPF